MTILEKVAHLKGLAEGLGLDEKKAESKLIEKMIGILDDMALTVSDLEDSLAILSEQVDAVDEDLDDLESFIFDEMDEDEDDLFDEDYYDVDCPFCNKTICVDGNILEEGQIHCPNCDGLIEFEIACEHDECDCGHSHTEDDEAN